MLQQNILSIQIIELKLILISKNVILYNRYKIIFINTSMLSYMHQYILIINY